MSMADASASCTGPSSRVADGSEPGAARFGIRLGGVAVVMPAGTPLEYVADTVIHPLPLAVPRVAGLMQLRGQPIVVLDAATPLLRAQVLRHHAVLVIGQPPEAAAVLVEEAPQALAALAPDMKAGADAARPDSSCAFAAALGARLTDPGKADDYWYEVEPTRVFELLVRG